MVDPLSTDEVVQYLREKAGAAAGEPVYVSHTISWMAQLVEDAYPPGSEAKWADIAVMLAPHSAQCE